MSVRSLSLLSLLSLPPLPPLPFRYVTSDCDADNDVVFSHHYTDIPEQGVADVLKAGTSKSL